MLLGSSLVYTHAHHSLICDLKGIALPKKQTKTIMSLVSHSHVFQNLYDLFSSVDSKGFTSSWGFFFKWPGLLSKTLSEKRQNCLELHDSSMMFSYCRWMAQINAWHSFCASQKKTFLLLFLFNSNRITRDGAKCLSEVLKQSRSLEILDLSSNRIEDDGAVYLSEAIKLPHSKLKA